MPFHAAKLEFIFHELTRVLGTKDEDIAGVIWTI